MSRLIIEMDGFSVIHSLGARTAVAFPAPTVLPNKRVAIFRVT